MAIHPTEARSRPDGRNLVLRIGPILALCAMATGCRAEGTAARVDQEARPAACWRLAAVPGPEDLVVDDRHDRLLVSSRHLRGDRRRDGAIWTVPLEPARAPRAHPLKLFGRDDCSFHPHGIDQALLEDGRQLLYVLNHHAAEDTGAASGCFPADSPRGAAVSSVEVFLVERSRLRFLQRLAAPSVLKSGNDLVARPNGDLWITDPATSLARLSLERARWLLSSRLVHFDCERPSPGPDGALAELRCNGTWRRVRPPGGLGGAPRYPNGIAWDPAREELLVAATLDDAVFVYAVTGAADLELVRRIPVAGDALLGPDNLSWIDAERTRLLAAGHPDARRFLQHAQAAQVPSPSAVWSVTTDVGESRRVFEDPGVLISGSSVAACAGGDLVVGQVFETGVFRCRVAEGVCPGRPTAASEAAR